MLADSLFYVIEAIWLMGNLALWILPFLRHKIPTWYRYRNLVVILAVAAEIVTYWSLMIPQVINDPKLFFVVFKFSTVQEQFAIPWVDLAFLAEYSTASLVIAWCISVHASYLGFSYWKMLFVLGPTAWFLPVGMTIYALVLLLSKQYHRTLYLSEMHPDPLITYAN